MKIGDPEILVAVSMARASPAERLRAAEVAFRYAGRVGIDSIKVQPAFIREPPDALAEAVNNWIKAGNSKRRWVVFEEPSADDIARALAATPYIEAVNLLDDRRVLVSISDAADVLDLEIGRTEWERLRPELESILGASFEYDTEELTGTTSG